MISLTIDSSINYPDGSDSFSPDEYYPEYKLGAISTQKNPVYSAVRGCFAQAGLDRDNFGSLNWNPLGEWIKRGMRVFVLCNFASDRRTDESIKDYRSRCTHGSVIRAVVDYILIAVGESGHIDIGNAPVQFCHWDKVLVDTEVDKVFQFYNDRHLPIEANDMRIFINDSTDWGAIRSIVRRDENNGVHVNLGNDSLLTELEKNRPQRFRVMNYDPNRTMSFHSNGKHEYVVGKKILEADVIFSIPKFKTHEKVGISCALKGFVGTVGHKDSLPHHRFGSPKIGGDEYPVEKSTIARIATSFHEFVQKTKPDYLWGSLLRVAYRILKRLIRPFTPIVEGAWWGNDTCWRMVLDLVRIATYCSPNGTMQDKLQRKQLVLIDGIIGGEGEGPAYSTAKTCGVLLFGDNLPVVDRLNAEMMGFPSQKIPLIKNSFNNFKYPILPRNANEESYILNSNPITIDEIVHDINFHFKPQDGWKEILTPKN